MLTYEEFDKYVTELLEYAQYEGTEVGEYWTALIRLQDEMCYMSTHFKVAYQEEIISTLEFIKENYRWEEVTIQSQPIRFVTTKTLEWVGDEG